jgi:hypothetical protein
MKKLTLLLFSLSISAEKRQKLSFITGLVQEGTVPRRCICVSRSGGMFVVMRIGVRVAANSDIRSAKDSVESLSVAP